jgi:hypothetical protein
VGWYLMMPPLSHGSVDNAAPLGTWIIETAFDTAKECENYKFNAQERNKSNLASGNEPAATSKQRFAEALLFSQCVNSDDPRFAK